MDDRTSINVRKLNEDKRARIEAALRTDPFRSDRVIAIETRTSQPSAYRVRKKLEQDGIIKPAALGSRRWTNKQDYLERVTKIITDELKKDFKRSDRLLASQIGVSPHSIKKVRAQLEQSGDIVPVTIAERMRLLPSGTTGSKINVPHGKSVEELIRAGMKMEKVDGISAEKAANAVSISHTIYRKARSIVILNDRTDLGQHEIKIAQAALAEMNKTNQVLKPYQSVSPILDKIWGQRRGRRFNEEFERKKIGVFNHAIDFISDTCAKSIDVTIPRLSGEEANSVKERISQAISHLRQFKEKLRR